jgi:hypothetical protein
VPSLIKKAFLTRDFFRCPTRENNVYTRVGTYMQRGSKFCFILVLADTLIKILPLYNYNMLSAYCTIACRLARQPCPAAFPSSLARQPCPAALPGSLARQSCPAALQKDYKLS